MSNPLSEQIAKLLAEILRLERERSDHQEALENPTSTELADQFIETKGHEDSINILTREIDLRRQELISLELLMLDNSIKDLRSTTSQVDRSVQSLDETTNKVLKSSTKLERLTTLLVYVTIMLAIIATYNVALVLGASNPYYGAIGVIAVFAALVYFMYRVYQAVRRGEITPLRIGRTLLPEAYARLRPYQPSTPIHS